MKKYQEGDLTFVLAEVVDCQIEILVPIICLVEEVWNWTSETCYLVKALTPERYGIAHSSNNFIVTKDKMFSLKNFAAQQAYKNPGIEFEYDKQFYMRCQKSERPTINLRMKSLNYAKNQEMNEKLKHPRKRKILTSCKELSIKKDQ